MAVGEIVPTARLIVKTLKRRYSGCPLQSEPNNAGCFVLMIG